MNKTYRYAFLAIILILIVTGVAGAASISKDEFSRLLLVEKMLHQQIAEMESELKTSKQLETYKKSYLASLPKSSPRPIADTQIARSLAEARYVIMGDEHTTSQAQANTVTVLSMMRAGKEPLTLVLEWIDISYQKQIDEFLAGRVPLKDLRDKISFDKLWGFSWASYSKILSAAKKLKTPILLVERLKGNHSLANRDTFITKTIAEHAKKTPGMRYLVVYGDYHVLGTGHLSDKMAKAGLKPQTILIGEARDIYWKLLGQLKDPEKIGFAQLGSGIFYVRNGTPLERSLSYRDYLMKMLGYSKSDFEEWVSPADIKAKADGRNNFEALHNP